MLKAKLNFKFFIAFVLLLVVTFFCFVVVADMSNTKILTEDGAPMSDEEQTVLMTAFCVVALSWAVSVVSMLGQIFRGYGFYMDESGIHNTLSLKRFLAFIFALPVKEIPYDAIVDVEKDGHVTVLVLDKSKIDVFPLFKPLINKRYSLFSGFTSTDSEEINRELERRIKLSSSTLTVE